MRVLRCFVYRGGHTREKCEERRYNTPYWMSVRRWGHDPTLQEDYEKSPALADRGSMRFR